MKAVQVVMFPEQGLAKVTCRLAAQVWWDSYFWVESSNPHRGVASATK